MPKPIHLFIGDLRQEPTGVLREKVTSKCELLELLWNYNLQERRNGSMRDNRLCPSQIGKRECAGTS